MWKQVWRAGPKLEERVGEMVMLREEGSGRDLPDKGCSALASFVGALVDGNVICSMSEEQPKVNVKVGDGSSKDDHE